MLRQDEHIVLKDDKTNLFKIKTAPPGSSGNHAFCVALPEDARCPIRISPEAKTRLKTLIQLLRADRFFHIIDEENSEKNSRTVWLDIIDEFVVLRMPDSPNSSLVPPRRIVGKSIKRRHAKPFAVNCRKWFQYDRILRIQPSSLWDTSEDIYPKVQWSQDTLFVQVDNKSNVSVCPIVILMRLDGSIFPITEHEVVAPGGTFHENITEELYTELGNSACVNPHTGRFVVRVFIHQYEPSQEPTSLAALYQRAFIYKTSLTGGMGFGSSPAPKNWAVWDYVFNAPPYWTGVRAFISFASKITSSAYRPAASIVTTPIAVADGVWERLTRPEAPILDGPSARVCSSFIFEKELLLERWNCEDRPGYKYLTPKNSFPRPDITGCPSDYWFSERSIPERESEGLSITLTIDNKGTQEMPITLMRTKSLNAGSEECMLCSPSKVDTYLIHPKTKITLSYQQNQDKMSLLVNGHPHMSKNEHFYIVPLPKLEEGHHHWFTCHEGRILSNQPIFEELEPLPTGTGEESPSLTESNTPQDEALEVCQILLQCHSLMDQ